MLLALFVLALPMLDPSAAVPAAMTTECWTWTREAPNQVARQEVSFTAAGGKLYLAGGQIRLQQAYDPITKTWKRVHPLPVALDHIQAIALRGLVYYIGGLADWPSPSVRSVYIYDPVADSFSKGAPMPLGRGRGAGSATSYHGRIYVSGGLHAGSSVPWFDMYNPHTNAWTSLPDMPRARDHVSAGVADDRLFVIGGQIRGQGPVGDNTAYDFTTGRWTGGLAPLPTLRAGTATAVMDGRVVVIGGEDADSVHSDVEAFDPATNTWEQLPPMRTARHGTQAAEFRGGAYVADGGAAPRHQAPTDVQEALHVINC